jgi:alpha-tubulin suppressor-like RCC1 family protein
VPGLTDVVRVAAGTLRTCALRRDGTVWCWGQDEAFPDGTSAVGYGAATDEKCVPFESATVRHPEYAVPCRRRPTQIPGITDAVDLSVGTSHACVVRAGGQVLCWGANSGGQLGDGTTHYRTTPTPVRWY